MAVSGELENVHAAFWEMHVLWTMALQRLNLIALEKLCSHSESEVLSPFRLVDMNVNVHEIGREHSLTLSYY